jgi:hypothetical protein
VECAKILLAAGAEVDLSEGAGRSARRLCASGSEAWSILEAASEANALTREVPKATARKSKPAL